MYMAGLNESEITSWERQKNGLRVGRRGKGGMAAGFVSR